MTKSKGIGRGNSPNSRATQFKSRSQIAQTPSKLLTPQMKAQNRQQIGRIQRSAKANKAARVLRQNLADKASVFGYDRAKTLQKLNKMSDKQLEAVLLSSESNWEMVFSDSPESWDDRMNDEGFADSTDYLNGPVKDFFSNLNSFKEAPTKVEIRKTKRTKKKAVKKRK